MSSNTAPGEKSGVFICRKNTHIHKKTIDIFTHICKNVFNKQGGKMKKTVLIKKLKEKGARFFREGSRHEMWISKNGKPFPVPRHNEINEITAKGILKDADK